MCSMCVCVFIFNLVANVESFMQIAVVNTANFMENFDGSTFSATLCQQIASVGVVKRA